MYMQRESARPVKTALLFASLSAIFPRHQMVVLKGIIVDTMLLEKKDAAGKRTDLGRSVSASKAILMTKAELSRLH